MIKLRSISSRLIITYLIHAVLSGALLLSMFAFGLKSECVENVQAKLGKTVTSIKTAYGDFRSLSTAGAQLEKKLQEIADFQESRIWIYDKFGIRSFDVNGSGSGLADMDAVLEKSLEKLEDAIASERRGINISSDDDILSTPIITYTSPLKIEKRYRWICCY